VQVVEQAKGFGRDLIRRHAIATASSRPLPDFLVIGGKRSASTSLYHTLLTHPQVLPMHPSSERFGVFEHRKGMRFFDNRYANGEAWYRSHFPSERARRRRERAVGGPVVSGEATPRYLTHPHAPARAAAMVPDARLVLLVRDPVERAFSHYRSMVRDGMETLSFEEAVEAEPERLDGEEARLAADPTYRSKAVEKYSYLGSSEYVVGVKRWLEHYDREQLLVRRAEDFFTDPSSVLADVAVHLGIRVVSLDAASLNAAPSAGLSDETRRVLRERLRASVEELESVLGQEFAWWDD